MGFSTPSSRPSGYLKSGGRKQEDSGVCLPCPRCADQVKETALKLVLGNDRRRARLDDRSSGGVEFIARQNDY
jgi:hypothetical protein